MFGIDTSNSFSFDVIELEYLRFKLELGWLPVITGRLNNFTTYEERDKKFVEVKKTLQDKGYLTDGEVIDETLVELLNSFAFANRNIDVRYTYPGFPVKRFMIGRRGKQNVLFYRYGDDIKISDFWSDGTAATLTTPLRYFLKHNSALADKGIGNKLEFQGITVDMDNFEKLFQDLKSSEELIDRLYGLSRDENASQKIGFAFGKLIGYAEIVFSSHEEGIDKQASGAVSIYDTLEGRILMSPHISVDDKNWLTILPGSNHYLESSIDKLVNNLSISGWY